MRLYRNAIILLVILAALVGSYIIISKKESPKEENKQATEKIFEADRDKTSKITIVNQGVTLVVESRQKDKGREWAITTPKNFMPNKESVTRLLSVVSSISALKVVEEDAPDLAKYGLDKPVVMTIDYEGGSRTFELGDKTQTKEAYYFKEKGKNKVYTIETFTGDQIKFDLKVLRDNKLYTVAAESAQYLSMSKGNNVVFAAKKGADNSWIMTAPIEGNADAAKISTMFKGISEVSTFVELIEENPSDLEKYGLKNPAYSLEFDTENGKTKMLVGNEKEKDQTFYAKLANKNEVFTINSEPLNFLDKPLKEIMEVFAYIVNIQDVREIHTEMDGKTVNSEIVTDKDNKDNDKFTVNGKDASALKDEKNSSLFRKYYQALIGVTMEDVDTVYKPAGPAEITLTYKLTKEPHTMKVEFVPKDKYYYYVVRNGKYSNIVVLKNKFDEPDGVRDTQKKLLDALK